MKLTKKQELWMVRELFLYLNDLRFHIIFVSLFTEQEAFLYLTDPAPADRRMSHLNHIKAPDDFVEIKSRDNQWLFEYKRGQHWELLNESVPGVWWDPTDQSVLQKFREKIEAAKLKRLVRCGKEMKKNQKADMKLRQQGRKIPTRKLQDPNKISYKNCMDWYIFHIFLQLIGGQPGLRRVVSIYHMEKDIRNKDLNLDDLANTKKKYVKRFLRTYIGNHTLHHYDENEAFKLSKKEKEKLSESPIVEALYGEVLSVANASIVIYNIN